MTIEIVDFPMKNGDFPVRYVNVYQRVLVACPASASIAKMAKVSRYSGRRRRWAHGQLLSSPGRQKTAVEPAESYVPSGNFLRSELENHHFSWENPL